MHLLTKHKRYKHLLTLTLILFLATLTQWCVVLGQLVGLMRAVYDIGENIGKASSTTCRPTAWLLSMTVIKNY